ncbi:MAG: AAA family ATPase [Gammaproteobacteria bacterium]|nr:AAA family ATPase [Gammaproteobacteria bacterium]
MVSIDEDGDPTVIGRLNRLFTTPGDTSVDVHRLLLDAAPPSTLEWSDFDHVAEGRDHIAKLLEGALRMNAAGVNIILYGAPGTGKTTLCRMLAEQLNMTLYSVGESDESGDEPTRAERLQELRLAQRLLTGNRGALLLFDEMEDLLAEPPAEWDFFRRPHASRWRQGGSKVYLHRLLEQAPTPTLWTMNDARQVHPAIQRRMTYALELRRPNVTIRARIWGHVLDRHGIAAGADDARALAMEFAVSPGVATGATAGARLAGGDIAAVRHGVRSLARLLGHDRPAQATPARFDLALVHADTDPIALTERIAACGEQRFSLCLQGPPGTGKSAYVRHLAERLGLEVMQRRASDLLSKWVGESEQQIAAAFAEARDTEAFLVFDEADSLLADRQLAQRTWEVSQVNEMLTWMESHPLPFACTTNFATRLDAATRRRFVFHMTLRYLTPVQAGIGFRRYFALTPPAELSSLTALTPGDFAVVRRKAGILGCLDEPAALVSMLREESEAKPDHARPIGFRH